MIAIHSSSFGFHSRWISYCKRKCIPYKLVNCYSNDLIDQLKDCRALMWHFHQGSHRDNLIAKQILFALEHTGFKVFPDFRTVWHFDDKVAQKYLFDAIEAPIIPTYVFLDKKEALIWSEETTFPKVFKLRGGAGSQNVQLIKTKADAKKIIQKAFGKGFSKYNAWGSVKERWRKFILGKASFFEVLKGIIRLFCAPPYARLGANEVGYVYFQDFIEDLDCDYRIIFIDEKIVGIRRDVRDNDFRASGSGKLAYTKSLFSSEMIKLARDLAFKLSLQSAAFDFVIKNEQIYLVEVSYGFPSGEFADNCTGYWDKDLNWQEGKTIKEEWMVDLVLKSIQE